MEEIPPKSKEKEIKYNKTTSDNEIYSLKMKIKKNNSIYMSITFENANQVYEDCKLYDEIKKAQSYFEIIVSQKFLMKFQI